MKFALAFCCLVSLSLLFNACGGPVATTAPPTSTAPSTQPAITAPSTPPTTAAASAPRYGGTLKFALTADISSFDDAINGGPSGGATFPLTHEELWGGDWARGPAGGFGTKETDWSFEGLDLFGHKAGYIAESWSLTIDEAKQAGTIVYKIRRGIRWALNPVSDTSKLVGGRELTAEDVVATVKQATTDARAYIYRSNPELRSLDIAITAPFEVTVKVPLKAVVTAMSRLGDAIRISPPEVREKTGDWKNPVGTGPFMLTDFVPGSAATLVKNPKYWMKDPIGPGKGSQLPYLDGVKFLIIPDASTRLAAFRTGKIDMIWGLAWEDADQLKKQFPTMSTGLVGYYGFSPMYMRTDKAPYSDVRVRRALMMATDFNSIRDNFNGGKGILITFPYDLYPEYKDLYVGLDDPDLAASVKELYVYSPDKAKKLLSDAGYPNGFKTAILCLSEDADYYSVMASMWAKVGVGLTIDVREAAVRTNIMNNAAYEHMGTGGKGPVGIYYGAVGLTGVPTLSSNQSFISDSYITDTVARIRVLAATNEKQAMALNREMTKYALDQAYAIPRPSYRGSLFAWPWIKNYTDELSIGYFNAYSWTRWVWMDETLKKSMGF